MPIPSKDENVEQSAGELEALAHDLRGSLHALRMGRELLKQLCSDGKLQEVCDAMAAEERRASELVDKLLAAAQRQA